MLEGLAWDAAGRRYETLAELLDYAVRVAGAVGAMMAVLMGRRAPEVVARAYDLGMAMQLSISRATSAKTRTPDAFICRLPGCARSTLIRKLGLPTQSTTKPSARSSDACCGRQICCTSVLMPASTSSRCRADPDSGRRGGCMPKSAVRCAGAASTRCPAEPWCRCVERRWLLRAPFSRPPSQKPSSPRRLCWRLVSWSRRSPPRRRGRSGQSPIKHRAGIISIG